MVIYVGPEIIAHQSIAKREISMINESCDFRVCDYLGLMRCEC